MAADARVRGFTLVELLVALTIFGMVVGIASYGYSLFTRQWGHWHIGFDRAQSQFQRLDLVTTALDDTLPWVVRDDAGRPGFYFLGREEGLTLVTQSAVFNPRAPAVIRLFREPAGDGRWNLVYEEAPLGGVLLRAASQTLPFQNRMVVMHDLPRPEFAYFGWGTLDERTRAEGEPELALAPQWYTEYDGLKRRLHPERIAIQLGGTKAVFLVPERADTSLRRYLGPE
jgi:prepilin-type N-terminal cleavage/methylation domain-containing protein